MAGYWLSNAVSISAMMLSGTDVYRVTSPALSAGRPQPDKIVDISRINRMGQYFFIGFVSNLAKVGADLVD